MDNKLEQAVEREFQKVEKREWWQSKKPESEWEYDAYFDQPKEGMIKQERVTYKRRADGRVERETIVRRFYGDNDYQDSTTTEIL